MLYPCGILNWYPNASQNLSTSFDFCLPFSEGSSNTHGGGAQSRPLGSDDLRLIEEDLSKQLSVDTVDQDLEPNTEPYVCSLENGGEMTTYILYLSGTLIL